MYFFLKYKSKDAFLREIIVDAVYQSFEYILQLGGKSIAFLVVSIKSLVRSSTKSFQFKKFQSQITIH